jgi:hypothetical protein
MSLMTRLQGIYPTAVVHIFAITVAIGPAFVGTRFISGLMLLANGYLVCWDWDR